MKKRCTKCEVTKDINLFYSFKLSRDGHQSQCKCCAKINHAKRRERVKQDPALLLRKRECQRKYDQKNKRNPVSSEKAREYYLRYLEVNFDKKNARTKFVHAVSSGKIKKRSCEICGDIKAQGHHEDYSKPFDVIWLCIKHHALRHRQLRGEPGIDLSPVFT